MKRPLVLGLGASGAAAARALLGRGAEVIAADDRAPQRAEALAEAGADVRLGGLDPALVDGRDLVVASPGVPPHHPLLVAATARGIPVWSEPELAWRLARGRTRLVAVTGTNGKTTTTELVAALLGAPAAGNIGTPLVELLAGPQAPPVAVAELSSFQLHFAHTLRPEVAVLLNVAGDHIDWHGSVEAYQAAKARVWAAQRPSDVVVVNVEDPGALATVGAHPPPGVLARVAIGGVPEPPAAGVRGGAIVWRPSDGDEVEVVDVADLRFVGPHNVLNACAAVAAAVCAGADPRTIGPAVAGFASGPHRLEPVATADGVAWVNDSKATNPHAAAAALRSFSSVVWIAGGLDKDLDFEVLSDLLPGRVRAALTIGSCGPVVAALARRMGVETVEAGTLPAAVAAAARLARPGDTVLLAPAAASMDQFTDYAARGQAFRDLVADLVKRPGGCLASGRVAGGEDR